MLGVWADTVEQRTGSWRWWWARTEEGCVWEWGGGGLLTDDINQTAVRDSTADLASEAGTTKQVTWHGGSVERSLRRATAYGNVTDVKHHASVWRVRLKVRGRPVTKQPAPRHGVCGGSGTRHVERWVFRHLHRVWAALHAHLCAQTRNLSDSGHLKHSCVSSCTYRKTVARLHRRVRFQAMQCSKIIIYKTNETRTTDSVLKQDPNT